MEKIIILGFESQSKQNCNKKANSLGKDYQGRSYTEDSDKPDLTFSTSRKRFGSVETREEIQSSNPLAKGIQSQKEIGKVFDFQENMKKIQSNSSLKDQDQELAEAFYRIVNPGKIPDGHCAKCAFNTVMHFSGKELQEAEAINTEEFVKFSYWFYERFNPEKVKAEVDIVGKEKESFADFKVRVAEKVKNVTKSGEGALLSIGEGAHWLTAFNDGKRVWFVDSQTGKGFNLYRDESDKIEVKGEIVNIVKVSSEQIDEFMNQSK